MPEAGPESPGHVGHTPQQVQGIWWGARLRGLLSTNVPRVVAARGEVYAGQEFRQLQRFGRVATGEALARAEDYGRRMRKGGLEPGPLDFLPGLRLPRFTTRQTGQ